MDIQSYQINNVLNVYRRQLSQGKPNHSQNMDAHRAESDAVYISSEGKNQYIIEKVAERVLKKVTNFTHNSEFGREMARQVQNTEKEEAYIFNTIDDNNQKETRSIAIDNSQMLINRLDILAKATGNHKTE